MLLTIEKLIYGGDGLARIPGPDGRAQTVFVPFVLPGERVDAAITERKPAFARAQVESLVEPSPFRTAPPCSYFGRCGGCHYQHTGYENQLAIKAAIQRETLQRVAKIDPPEARVHAGEPWSYRNRTRLKVRSAPEFAIGYYRFGSHDLLPVEECPISSPLIARALRAVWQAGRDRLLDGLSEIEFFANAADDALLLEFHAPAPDAKQLRKAAEALHASLPELRGVTAFRAVPERPFNVDRGELVWGEATLTYHAAGSDYRVSGGSFFQVNRFLADELVSVVCGDAKGDSALDLYAGVGLFSVPLAERFAHVTAVEIAPSSADDLRANAPRNVKSVRATTEQFLERPTKQRYDLVVADPPRGGLGAHVTKRLVAMNVPKIVYVSCDPATLARDLQALLAGGYRIEALHLLDLFPQTFHIESVVELSK